MSEHNDLLYDPALTPEEIASVKQLSATEIEEIDQALLRNVTHQWRKIARVVGTTMVELKNRVVGIPDIYYSQRVMHLIEKGFLDLEGEKNRMRFSEVRLTVNKDV
jgi:hypothetical protein